MKVLSNEEIKNLCTKIVSAVTLRDSIYGAYMETMYITGLRVSEVTEYLRWRKISDDYYCVRLEKSNQERIIEESILPVQFRLALVFEMKSHYYCYNRKLERLFRENSPYRHIKTGNRNINNHLFRHNFIKQLHWVQGLTITEIMNITKHNSQLSIFNYTNSKIVVS